MVFSSPLFLFLFLPLVLISQIVCARGAIGLRNGLLLAASLLFYSWGEPIFILLMIGSIIANHLFGQAIQRAKDQSRSTTAPLALGVTLNIAALALFKYAGFLVENFNPLLIATGLPALPEISTHLPLGISFYTFQAISYLVDIARSAAPAQKKLSTTALYISLFPQLIAGPIVRYHQIAPQLLDRTTTLAQFEYGVQRFVIGLGKKVLIANGVASFVDYAYALPPHALTTEIAWLAVLGYAIQIYFDFSGYSDMAIGLGAMFGFTFPENFKHPYAARSIREFWTRWHITLSEWFRDYLYIPLGGSRGSPLRTHINLLIVFFLCGLWHGAAWNFIIWGLLHGVLLIVERGSFGKLLKSLPTSLQHLYVVGFALLSWVPFRAESFEQTISFYKSLFGFTSGEANRQIVLYLTNEFLILLVIGGALSLPVLSVLQRLKIIGTSPSFIRESTISVALTLIFILSAAKLASGTYNPFIYFRF